MHLSGLDIFSMICIYHRITGHFCINLISAVFCGQLWTAEIKIAEYYVKSIFNVPYKIRFQCLTPILP